MAITVEQLLDVPTLRTRLLAGSSGLNAEIEWAHPCELARPWDWLGRGDLLMTTGRNVPTQAEEQVAFVRALSEVGVRGLVLAEGMESPPLASETSALAEELRFPIMETAYEIPFVALSRVVAAAGQGETQARLTRVLRVYDTYRTAIQGAVGRDQLLRDVGAELGHPIHVVDVSTGRMIAGSSLSGPALAAIRAHGAATLPGITRVKVGDEEYVLLPIGTHPGWVMVADVTGVEFDVLILQHANTIATIEAERLRAETETRLTVSARLLAHIVEGHVDSELIKDRLAEFGLEDGPWLVVTAASRVPVAPVDVMGALDAVDVPHLVTFRDDRLILLINVSEEGLRTIDLAMGVGSSLGVSNEFARVRGAADALRQADWAREAGRVDDRPISHYGQDRPLFLPATLAEADNVVRTVLGPLIDYDERHGTDLLDSLSTFFEANRSWQVASKLLQVHKQTLVYRMRRVAEVTGRRLDDLDDIAELHLALRTRQRFEQQ